MDRKEELSLFRKVCSKEKVVENPHTNAFNGNATYDANFNQGVSRAKLREFKEKKGLKFNDWKNL